MSNILRVSFRGKQQITAKPLYQYDYGQKVRIVDLDLPTHYEVHFSNYERGDAITVLASSNEFDIPDMYLQSGRDVYIWIYLHTGDDDGETEYQITIPIIKRAKPIDEEPIEEQQSIIDQTIIALNKAVTEARAISEDVTEKDGHVTQLYTYVNNAKADTYNYKEDAETAANLLKNVSAQAETLSASSEAIATYSQGVFNFGIPKGKNGENGNGIDYIILNNDYTLTIYYTNGDTWTSNSIRGAQGLSGEDGISPTISIEKIENGHRVIITDAEGTYSFDVLDGQRQDLSEYALKSQIPIVTNDFTNEYKSQVDTLWNDYQSAIAALG